MTHVSSGINLKHRLLSKNVHGEHGAIYKRVRTNDIVMNYV